MCGISGLVGPAAETSADPAAAMANALAHRGPDDAGLWSTSFPTRSGGDHVVALGHRRLSIIDLSAAGRQPMRSRDGQAVVCVNGEIYNFRELKTRLEGEGARFSTHSDMEVVAEGFRVWGLDLFERLHGMFAAAVWDGEKRRLVLVRDRLGIKPLYYAQLGGRLAFSSELHALRGLDGFSGEIDAAALAHFLSYGYVAGPGTIYAAASRLMPGHMLEWREGEISVRPYWSLLDAADRDRAPRDLEQVTDDLEELLRASVLERLVADVPVGAFLSGGIDSSAVVSMMAEVAPSRVQTFTIGFDEPGFDESAAARAVAEHLGTDHHELEVTRAAAVEVARELPTLFDEPFADASAIPTTLVSRLARQSVKVVLSGDGGDELFGGYSRYRRIEELAGLFRFPAGVRRALAAAASWAVSPARRHRVRRLGAPQAVDFADGMTARFDDRLVARATGASARDARAHYRAVFAAAGDRGAAERAMLADAATYLVDDILTKLDRASMSVALEARVPLLDHRLVAFAHGLPLSLLWSGGATKAPLRALAARRVPAELLERPKSGFGFPVAALLGEELDAWTRHYLDRERLAEEGLLDPDAVERMVATTDRNDRTAIRGLWNLLCFERWFAVHERGERSS